MRTYEIDLDGTGATLLRREMPRSFAAARTQAETFAARNARWCCSVWTAIDGSGDAFRLNESGHVEDYVDGDR